MTSTSMQDPTSAPAGWEPGRARRVIGVVVLAIVIAVVATFFRFYRLHTLPGTLYYDEAQNGVDTLRIIGGDRPIFFTANNGREPLFIYLQALSVAILGASPFSLRIVSAIVGCLTVVALYFVGRELLGARAGYLAALWLAMSYWHVSLSRLGFRAVLLPLTELGCVYFAAVALRRGSLRAATLAGLCHGLSFYTYGAARLFPLAFLAVVAGLWLGRGAMWGITRDRIIRVVACVAVVSALIGLPLGLYFVRHPEYAFGRADQVAIGGASDPRVLQGLPPRSLPENIAVTLGMFGISGDDNLRHDLPGRPVFDLPTFGLFVSGLWAAFQRKTRWVGLLTVPWLLVMLGPGAVTAEAPHFLRTVGALPPAFLLLGFAGDQLLRRSSRLGKWLATVGLAALLIFGAADTTQAYFQRFANDPGLARVFDAHIPPAVAQVRQWRDQGIPVWLATAQEHPLFPFLLSPAEQPTKVVDSLSDAVGLARAHGGPLEIVCFGCDTTGTLPVILVSARSNVGDGPERIVNRATLDDRLELVGYSLAPAKPQTQSSTGSAEDTRWLEASLHWRSLDVVGKRYRAELHFYDSAGQLVAIADDQMDGRLWPTSLWRVGEEYVTVSLLRLPANAAASLRLSVELAEVPLEPARGPVAARIDLETIRIPPP